VNTPSATHNGTNAVVTALMPVKAYHEPFLREAVDSIASQTDPRWRLLIIVDPKVRAELARVLSEALSDERVEMIDTEGRQLAGAFNTGMRHAGTDWVAIILGDDLWAPQAVEVLDRAMRAHPDADFFHSARVAIDERGRPLSNVMPSRRDVTLEDFGGASPVKHLLCWRREKALEMGGMDESLDSVGVDDWDFPWSMAEAGARFQTIEECLYIYRDHLESFRLTTHLPKDHHRREIARIMRKHGVDEERIAAHLVKAEEGWLRQCIYDTRAQSWLRRLTRRDPRRFHQRERYP
jgi:glycosyltransferase involved in cell wall biosynthesis